MKSALEQAQLIFSFLKDKAAKYLAEIYAVSEQWMKTFSLWLTDYYERKKMGKRKSKIHRIFLFLVLALPLALLLTIFSGSFVFITPVGSSAAITRFGAFNREVDSGLHFYIPLIEKYYIVNTMNIMEETFGFIQRKNMISPVQSTPQDIVIQQHERAVEQSERDLGNVFSERGHVLDSLGQQQRLPHDYLRRRYLDTTPQASLEPPVIAQSALAQDVMLIPSEMKMITAGLNIINITWTLQYQIKNAEDYLFNSRDVEINIRDISQAMMNETIGDWSFVDVIGASRYEIEKETKEKIQKWFDSYKIGIEVIQVIILNALPPDEVVFAFNEVNKAMQDMENTVYQAEIEYLNIIPEAVGEAKRIIADAEAYAVKIVDQAKGESERFEQIVAQYEKAQQITKDRLYIEAMEGILKRTPNAIIDQGLQGVWPVFTGNNQNFLEPLAAPLNGSGSISQPLVPAAPSLSIQAQPPTPSAITPAPIANPIVAPAVM